MLEFERMLLQRMINNNPRSREELEILFGKDQVWDTNELTNTYNFDGFMAPMCLVTRKSDKVKGAVCFQHFPRFYFSFEPLNIQSKDESKSNQ